jgi:hypothetical protein
MRACMLRYRLHCWMLPLLLLLVACSNDASTAASNGAAKTTRSATAMLPPPTATSTQGARVADCKPASAITKASIGLPEIQGTGRGMEIWALLFGDLKVNHDQKIVWRLTGDGDPQFTTTGPQGEHARVVFGPTAHGSSNWQRPGDEWGIGFNFQAAGCWDLHVSRGKAIGDVWLIIK